MNYNLDPKLKCVKCQKSLPWLKCSPDHFRYFVNGKGDYYCDACLPHDLLEQRIEREHFHCHCWGGKLFNKCHDLRRNIRNNPLYWDNGTFKFECYQCGRKLGKNGEKVYECEEPHCERKFCSCRCRSLALNCRKPNHQTENNQNSPNENFEQIRKSWQRVHEKAQSWWDTLSNSEREKECERIVVGLKRGEYEGGRMWRGNKDMEGYGVMYIPNGSFWQIKNGKYVSSQPHLVPGEIAEEFMEKEFGNVSAMVLRDYQIIKKDNSDDKDNLPPPNLTSGLITDASDKSDNSKPNPGKDNPSEAKNNAKTIKFENKENEGKNNFANPTEKSPNETDNKTLVINLSDIKRITLTFQGQLIVEFNNSKSHNMTAEQVNNNSELQTIKNYCQKSGKSSLSRFELDKIFSTNETNAGSASKSTDNNHALVIGLSVAVTLIIGLASGLLLKRKRNSKRS